MRSRGVTVRSYSSYARVKSAPNEVWRRGTSHGSKSDQFSRICTRCMLGRCQPLTVSPFLGCSQDIRNPDTRVQVAQTPMSLGRAGNDKGSHVRMPDGQVNGGHRRTFVSVDTGVFSVGVVHPEQGLNARLSDGVGTMQQLVDVDSGARECYRLAGMSPSDRPIPPSASQRASRSVALSSCVVGVEASGM